MKLKFTLFNNGQEYVEFDTDSLPEGTTLDRFLVNKDANGVIYIVPMINERGCRYAGQVLERT